jgi:hypothetical protein
MADQRAAAISVQNLSAAVQKAVSSSLAKYPDLKGSKPEPGIVIDPIWINGFILDVAALKDFAQLQSLATDVANEVQRSGQFSAHAVTAPVAAVYWYDHRIICGYRPVPVAEVQLYE